MKNIILCLLILYSPVVTSKLVDISTDADITSRTLTLQERHLQRVINARQNFSESRKAIVIPIPDAAIPVHHYSTVYQTSSNAPLYYIRVPGK